MACLWYTDTSQASSCARCQAYKKSCREGAPGKGVLLPKKRRVVVVDNDIESGRRMDRRGGLWGRSVGWAGSRL